MTETAERREGSARYASPGGIDRDSIPFKLWERSKQLFWDPADIDLSRDVRDWAEMSEAERRELAGYARGFMVGEEAVTLDILPLVRAMSDEGYLEDTMYLSMFAMEEAKHVDFFRRWFDAVDFDPRLLDGTGGNGYGGGSGDDPFAGLARVMRRLDTDRSPKRILDATLLYNHLIEAVFAIAGYRRWDDRFGALGGKLPGLREGLAHIQRDERRHIAYGTYLSRRIIAENPELWDWVEERWAKMAGPLLTDDSADPIASSLAKRRLEVLAVARSQSADDVGRTDLDDFEPADLPAR